MPGGMFKLRFNWYIIIRNSHLSTNKILNSVTLDLTVQTVNTGIISGLMLCSLQKKRNFLRNLANRGENEASRREARIAQKGKRVRKLNSHRARLAFPSPRSLFSVDPKSAETYACFARCFVSLSNDSPGTSARAQILVKWSALQLGCQLSTFRNCNCVSGLFRNIAYHEKVNRLAKQDTVIRERI